MRKISAYLLLTTIVSASVWPPEAQARRQLVPQKPSIELNLDVLEYLRARRAHYSVAQRPQALPFAQGASQAVRSQPLAVPSAPTPAPAPAYAPVPVAPKPVVSVPTVRPSVVLPKAAPSTPTPVFARAPAVEQAVQAPKAAPTVPSARRAPVLNEQAELKEASPQRVPVIKPQPAAPKRDFAVYEPAKPKAAPKRRQGLEVPPSLLLKPEPVVKKQKAKAKPPVAEVKKAAIEPPKPKAPPQAIQPPVLPEPDIAHIEFEEFPKLEPLPQVSEPAPEVQPAEAKIPPMPKLEDIPAPEVLPPLDIPSFDEPVSVPEPTLAAPAPVAPAILEATLPDVPPALPEIDEVPALPTEPPAAAAEIALPEIEPVPALPEIAAPAPQVPVLPPLDAPVPEVLAPVVPPAPPAPEVSDALPDPDLIAQAAPDIAPIDDLPEIAPLAPANDLPVLPSLSAITGEPDDAPTLAPPAAPDTAGSVVVADAPIESLPKISGALPSLPAFGEAPTLPSIPAAQDAAVADPASIELPSSLPEPNLPEPTLVASLPEPSALPENSVVQPQAPVKAEKKNLSIEFAQTENEIPASAKPQLDSLAAALKDGGAVTIRPYVGLAADGSQLANVIGTRRAFAIRTYLIDKGVSHFNISIDRNQASSAGTPERVELLVR